jgi:hypothetical protein
MERNWKTYAQHARIWEQRSRSSITRQDRQVHYKSHKLNKSNTNAPQLKIFFLSSSVISVSPWTSLRALLAVAGIVVQEPVLETMRTNPDLAPQVPLCDTPQAAATLYKAAADRLGSSTKRAVTSVDPKVNIVIDGIFVAKSTSSVFYYAYDAGKPCLLKISKKSEGVGSLTKESEVYKAVEKNAATKNLPDHWRQSLVRVELVQLLKNKPNEPPQPVTALKSPVFVGTLADCPSDPRLAQLYSNAGESVIRALELLHSSGIVHCDVKPDNIFVDSTGQCLLGDYDAAEALNSPVVRSTSAFLPEPFRSRFEKGQPAKLFATPAVDFAMLACTLLSCLGWDVKGSPSLEQALKSLHEHIKEEEKATSALPQEHTQRVILQHKIKIFKIVEHCLNLVQKETQKALMTASGDVEPALLERGPAEPDLCA